ncbi:MAG: protein kinase, partial [Actinomycetota bacterium]|nr:protein kinase [Actinomycetota bacterium]
MTPTRRGTGDETPKRKTPARKKPSARRKASGGRSGGGRKAATPQAAFSEPTIGTTIGSYLIEAPLGRGGMGVLFRATDQRAATRGRRVALKVLAPSLVADERFRRRFERESQMAASLDHPNIVPIYEAGEDAGVLFIAMRYVEGEDLHTYLARTGPLDPEAAVALVAQV